MENGAPNGQGRDMILTNGQFPSPLLVFKEGDDVEITVNNDMHENTTVHWHGIDQRESPWSDGVPGLSQTPIEPGESYIYRFKAPLLVRHKKRTANPFHLISKDPEDIRSNFNSSRVLEATAKSKLQIFCINSVLINGKGNLHCPGQQWFTDMQIPFMQRSWPNDTISDKGCFPMQEGFMASTGQKEIIKVDANQQRWLSINWIGASTFKTLQPSINEHKMWIYEVDGHYIEPRKATTMLLWAGERYYAIRIGSELGMFSYSTVNEAIKAQPELFNLENPPYRDTFLNEFTGTMWVALRYQVTHPGAWLLHCHFETHLSNGMAMAILDGVDVWPAVPEEYANNGKGVLSAGSTGQKAENEPVTRSEPAANKQESLPKFRPETARADGQAVITYLDVATLALALAILG
ncbi:hypothetical protein MY3296_006923 [Beauveria thailandica]